MVTKSLISSYFEETISELEKNFENFDWSNEEFYKNWLAQTYYYVCHSTRLLALSAARFRVDRDKLHLRFLDHMKEEKRHEMLALKDLNNMGSSIEEYPELAVTAAFYQTQYYWIEHNDPIAFFGYILCLEGLAVRKGNIGYQKAIKAHGEKSVLFLKIHANEDPDHLEKAFSSLEDINKQDMELIKANLQNSCKLYLLMLDQIKAQKNQNLKRSA